MKQFEVQCLDSVEYRFEGEILLEDTVRIVFKRKDGALYRFSQTNVICVFEHAEGK